MLNDFSIDFESILLEEDGSKFIVTEASGMKWVNVQYTGTTVLHGKLFVAFINKDKEPLLINVSYLSSISKIHNKNIDSNDT